jgi:hypothetical protein
MLDSAFPTGFPSVRTPHKTLLRLLYDSSWQVLYIILFYQLLYNLLCVFCVEIDKAHRSLSDWLQVYILIFLQKRKIGATCVHGRYDTGGHQ